MVENFCMVLFSFFFFSSVFLHFSLLQIFFVTVGFCFLFFYKTLALKDSNTIQTMATNPHPWGPSQAGGFGAPAWLFCGCFPGVWRRWADAGSGGRWNLYSSSVGTWSQERIPEQDNN